MNNKSIIGLVLLVSMVLTKALVSFDGEGSPIHRTSNLFSTVIEALDERANHTKTNLEVNPTAHLLAANYSGPDYSEFGTARTNYTTFVAEESQLLVSVSLNERAEVEDLASTDDEALPLEHYTNTGYGLWKKSEETIKSFSDRPGEVPLDGGNTITANISKLFPRNN